MNEELSVQEKVIIKLHNRKFIDVIVDVCCKYHCCPKGLALKEYNTIHSKYVRNTIFYICHSIYGIQISFIVECFKCPYTTAFNGIEKLRETLNELGVQTDINNVRQILVKTFNG